MKPEERVMIIGSSTRPFDADVKGLCVMYQRIIMIPRPDYGSRVCNVGTELLYHPKQ
uniref:Uncharacterized protein n=1 Tax=Amphimedon queenslandica TaxID=400682 RepID=A0A1X7SHN2_AMPQE